MPSKASSFCRESTRRAVTLEFRSGASVRQWHLGLGEAILDRIANLFMATYCNPVYEGYFADPFVWRHDGLYYAVGTGPLISKSHGDESDFHPVDWNGRKMVFPLLRSSDLIHWESLGAALIAPEFAIPGGEFWAPEVGVHDGLFYLYYSVATSGLNHQLRVAVSSRPEGPYEDSARLIGGDAVCPFAIDAHPFRDSTGEWYLFYARDFLDAGHDCRAGTALEVDRLQSMTKLAGTPRVVLRARWDWQRFQTDREMYGGRYDWHTLEGPCVRQFRGRYYCFFSGGCYQGEGYGVDYGVADSVYGPYADAGSASGPRVLKTVPGQVLGPGHNSIVVGPDGKTDYIIYHAWDAELTARRMCIDPLIWTDDGPRCAGPSFTPQPI